MKFVRLATAIAFLIPLIVVLAWCAVDENNVASARAVNGTGLGTPASLAACVTTLPSGATPMFCENFSQASTGQLLAQGNWLASSQWSFPFAQSPPGNQCFVPGNVYLDGGGYLYLYTSYNPRDAAAAPPTLGCPSADYDAAGLTMPDAAVTQTIWDEAQVQMSHFAFTGGHIQMRAQLSGGGGVWPTMLASGANCEKPNVGFQYAAGARGQSNCVWPNNLGDSGSGETDFAEISQGHDTPPLTAPQLDFTMYTAYTGFGNLSAVQFLDAAAFPDPTQNFLVYDLDWDATPATSSGSNPSGTLLSLSINGVLQWQWTRSTQIGIYTYPLFVRLVQESINSGSYTADAATPFAPSIIDYIYVWCPAGRNCTVNSP